MEDFIKEITQWEDYDDDDTPLARIGYQMTNLPNTKTPEG